MSTVNSDGKKYGLFEEPRSVIALAVLHALVSRGARGTPRALAEQAWEQANELLAVRHERKVEFRKRQLEEDTGSQPVSPDGRHTKAKF